MPHQKQNGFTLIEMSLVLIIVGLIITAAIPSLKTYNAQKDFLKTRENMELAHEAVKEFYGLFGRYPCPADPDLAPGDPGFGEEIAGCGAGIPPCPAAIECVTSGSRDANNDGNPDLVLIGALPSRTLAENAAFATFEVANGHDAYKIKLTYAVSELMTEGTVNSPANSQLGAIAIKDEFNQDILDPPDSAHYIILSHGDNTRGGFTIDGGDIGDCIVMDVDGNLQPPGNNLGVNGVRPETENCDRDDAVFISGLRSLGDNDGYFDDMLFFNASSASTLWRRSNFNKDYLYNTNFGSVGVNEDNPQAKLDVNGDIRVETSTEAEGGYCAQDGTDCLLPDALGQGGAGMTPCPSGEVATGIENNQLVCTPLFAGPISFQCPVVGEFVRGFSNLSNGSINIDCAAP